MKARCVLPLTAALLLCGCTRTPKDVLPESVPQSVATADPGVAKPTPSPTPDPLAGMPDTITAPDRPCGDGEPSRYSTTADGNLTLRAGPGTDYDKVGTIPPSSTVECLGRSDAADNWILVCYEGQFGWACTDYMS